MTNINTYMPVEVISGKDCVKTFDRYNSLGEKCAIITGKNMYKNILVYVVKKGFIPEKTDNERVYLVKEYNKIKTKEELKRIYKDYIKSSQ